MDRAKKISILANMSDEALTRAMEANGIPCDDETYMDHLGPELAQGVESWTERDVSIPRTTRPQLVNSDFLFKSATAPQSGGVDPFGLPSGEEDFYNDQAAMGLEMF